MNYSWEFSSWSLRLVTDMKWFCSAVLSWVPQWERHTPVPESIKPNRHSIFKVIPITIFKHHPKHTRKLWFQVALKVINPFHRNLAESNKAFGGEIDTRQEGQETCWNIFLIRNPISFPELRLKGYASFSGSSAVRPPWQHMWTFCAQFTPLEPAGCLPIPTEQAFVFACR